MQSIKGGIPVGGNLGYFGSGAQDLLYRGEPAQMMPMPYQGGGFNIQPLAQGIPVGQDPRFPMDQKMFEAYVEEKRFKRQYPNRGDLLRYVDQFNKNYFPGSQVNLPANIGGKTIS